MFNKNGLNRVDVIKFQKFNKLKTSHFIKQVTNYNNWSFLKEYNHEYKLNILILLEMYGF